LRIAAKPRQKPPSLQKVVCLDPESGIYTTMRAADREHLADAEFFRRAYETHHDKLVQIAWRVLRDTAAAEDVVQDVFLELWTSPAAFDARRGNLRAYLRMVVKSRALDRWRSRVVALGVVERAKAEAAASARAADSAAEPLIRKETARAVRQAIDALPQAQREAILLAYGSGLSTPEVAAVTGTPLGTAKSRVRLGLAGARKALLATEAA
jgi:RNA polymerase sigma-70 factor (ECF subfamily)